MSATYATLDDVQLRMPQFVLSGTSKPSRETSQTFLADIAAEVNAGLRVLGYYTPVTDPDDVGQLRMIICDGTAARILYARAAAVGGDASMVTADRMWKLYCEALERLRDPKSAKVLTNTPTTGDFIDKPPGAGPAGLTVGPDGYPVPPHCTMDQLF